MALILSICAVSLIPQESEATDSSITLTTGADITESLKSVSSDTNLTINLQAGGSYTLTGVGFGGASLTINGNGATVVVSNTDNYAAWINSSYGGSVIIDGVNFKVTDNSSSYESCILYFAYFDDATVTDCNFDSIQLGLTTNTNKAPMDATVTNCHWTIAEGSKVFEGYYALNLAILDDVRVSGCTFTGYDRGMNIQLEGTGSSAYVKNCKFTSIGGKCALQLSGDVGYANTSFSGCTFSGCSTAVSIHESAKGDGSVLSYDNDYSSCETLLLYSADSSNQTSSVGFTSNDDSKNDITTPIGAEGTASAPINTISGSEWYSDLTIRTEADLREFAQMVNYGNDFSGQTVILGADIKLTSDSEWTPIGQGVRSGASYTHDSTPFKGTFDGGDHSISGLKITTGNSNADYAFGLFGIVAEGKVQNLTLLDVNIDVTGSEIAGAVVGLLTDGGEVFNCIVGSESDDSKVFAGRGNGGVVGRMTVEGTISECYNYAYVKGTNGSGNTGGIVGAAYYQPDGDGMNIIGCNNYGKVEAINAVGGIVGYSIADVSGCHNYGTVIGNGYSVGGIVGEQRHQGSVTGCYNESTGTVNNSVSVDDSVDEDADFGTGGIVGWIRYVPESAYKVEYIVSVDGCYNYADVTANGGTGVGGIVGMVYHSAYVRGCISSGDISGAQMVAAIIGGVQTTDSNHTDNWCRIVISDNTAGGSVIGTTATNINAVVGHLTDLNDTDACKINKGSRVTAYDNTINLEGMESGLGTYDSVAIIVVDEEVYGYSKLADAIANVPDGGTIQLVDDVTENITIPSGKTVVIDLNSNMLQGIEHKKGDTSSDHTITVEKNATLTINATNGGTVDSPDHGKACVYNEGTVVINGGTFTRSNEVISTTYDPTTEDSHSWYTIYNDGDMTINDGTFILGYQESDGTYYLGNISSLIINGHDDSTATLTINDGYFLGAGSEVRNVSGVLTITGGEFVMDNTEHAWVGANNVVQNQGSMTMTGGTYTMLGDGLSIDSEKLPSHGIYNSGTADVSGITLTVNGTGRYALYQVATATGSLTISNSTVSVTDATSYLFRPITTAGTDLVIVSGIYSGSVPTRADNVLIQGGTFSVDVTAYCDEGFKPIYNGTSYIVQAAHTVTFDYNGGIQVVVLDGDTVDVPDLPVREGYSYYFSVNDAEWDFSTAITQDIVIDVTEYISDIVVNVTFGTDSSGNVTFTATATSSVVQDFTYYWNYEGDEGNMYEGQTITNLGVGGYSAVAYAEDSDGVIGYGYCIFTYRQSYSDDPSDPPVQNVDITHSGQQLDEITVNSGTILVTSDGNHSDIDMSFDFDDDVVENAPTIEISGNVGTGVITITVTDLSSDSSAVVDRIVEDVNSSVTTDVTKDDVVSVDVSLDNVTSLERMIIKIPMGEVGKYVASGQAYYITENGSYVSVPSSIQGDEVWIYTDHNTPYVYVATSYAPSKTFEDEPDLGTDEPDITPPIIIPDDDDPVIPPTIIVDESSSDDGEAVKIAACAAAAVAAAIMALILVAEYRKR